MMNCAERCGVCCLSLNTETIVSLGTGCFYTILTLTFAKKRGGKGLLCLNTSYVPVHTIYMYTHCGAFDVNGFWDTSSS